MLAWSKAARRSSSGNSVAEEAVSARKKMARDAVLHRKTLAAAGEHNTELGADSVVAVDHMALAY